MKTSSEVCDNGNMPGCSSNCLQDKGYLCTAVVGQASQCSPICGDGIVVGDEKCDNGMNVGCKNYNCKKPDDGFTCTGGSSTSSSTCSGVCGDGIKTATEQCDNNNQLGCSTGCRPDKGYTCTGSTGQTSVCSPICGDMIVTGIEKCDNGKRIGCLTCLDADPGYTCKFSNKFVTYSTCTKI